MNLRYRVELSQTEREQLTALLNGGKHAARRLKRAQILLAADAGASDEEIARSVGAGGSTVYRTKRRFVLGNLEAALSEEPRPGARRKLSGIEIELAVLRSQCLDRRIATQEQLKSEIATWEHQRNASGARIKWMFTTDKARAKMGRAYPQPILGRQT